MSRTFLRQDTQIRNSDVYDDTLAAGSTLESAPANIEDDFNALRSQMQRVIGVTNWYDALSGRALSGLDTDLTDLEGKKLLFRTDKLVDIAVPASVAATGSIDADSGGTAVLPADTETFVLDDGINPAVTFEFDNNSSVVETATLRQVDITTATTDDDVRDAIITAVTNAPTLFISASNGGAGIVTLTNDQGGAHGNVTITETVAAAGFVVSGMSGGAGNHVTLVQASSETPSEVAAVTTAQNGAVVAVLGTDVGVFSLDEVAGTNAINPKNLLVIRDGSTGEHFQDASNRDIYGLLQAETGVTDGDSFNDADKQVQISFVVMNATRDDLIPADAAYIGGQTINYAYVRRINLDAIPEQAFLAGNFTDLAGSADVTLDNAIDNQVGPATQDQDIEWRIGDAYSLAFQDSTGGADILLIDPDAGGDIVQFNVATFDVNNSADADFLNGAKFDTGGTEIDVGVTAGYIESTSTNDLGIRGAGELYLDDGNQTGSTWAQTAGIKLSETTAEWDTFETIFGEVSLLNAITQAYQAVGNVKKTYANVTATTVADTDVGGVGGGTNLDAQIHDISNGDFLVDHDVFLNGQLLRPGADAAANNDYYPGTSLANGQLKFEFVIKLNDVLCVISRE